MSSRLATAYTGPSQSRSEQCLALATPGRQAAGPNEETELQPVQAAHGLPGTES